MYSFFWYINWKRVKRLSYCESCTCQSNIVSISSRMYHMKVRNIYSLENWPLSECWNSFRFAEISQQALVNRLFKSSTSLFSTYKLYKMPYSYDKQLGIFYFYYHIEEHMAWPLLRQLGAMSGQCRTSRLRPGRKWVPKRWRNLILFFGKIYVWSSLFDVITLHNW